MALRHLEAGDVPHPRFRRAALPAELRDLARDLLDIVRLPGGGWQRRGELV